MPCVSYPTLLWPTFWAVYFDGSVMLGSAESRKPRLISHEPNQHDTSMSQMDRQTDHWPHQYCAQHSSVW